MKFDIEPIGKYFSFRKGLGYLGKYLAESETGLIGINSCQPGGGYKYGGEKSYAGPYKPHHEAHPGDLFICTTDITQDGRVLGSPFLLPAYPSKFTSMIFSGDIVKAFRMREGLEPHFLFNALRIPSIRAKVAYASTGTTVRRIPPDVIETAMIPVPPMPVQSTIVNILATLDEKIRLNTELSKTLEAIAQTIFKSWFIDFDPVHAQARGEQPEGMDAKTAALFPDSFEDSELGPIPKGWGVEPVGDAVPCVGGSTPSTKEPHFWDGDIHWTTPKDLSKQSGPITVSSERMITREGLGRISSGLLPPSSVLMSSRAPIGYLSINAVPTAINQGFIAFPAHEIYPPLYLLNWLASSMGEIVNRSGGGTFSEISKTSFRSIPFLIPNEPVVSAFAVLTLPILDSLVNLKVETRSLTGVRDTLLPRLISGELEIPEEMLAS
jgi:type I restriction enzyme S subunit